MRVVVMDKDRSEPLTVIDVPFHLMEQAKDRRRLEFAVPESFREWFTMQDQMLPEFTRLRRVGLNFEPIVTSDGPHRTRVLYWIATPEDEELALLLRAAFLPGQVTELRRREARAWVGGVIGTPPPAQ